jgi:hypothetical protein
MSTPNRLSHLDRIRLFQGAAQLKHSFLQWAAQNKYKAISYINDEAVSFPCLFILLPEIEQTQLWSKLPPHHLAALYVCAKKWENHHLEAQLYPLAPQDDAKKHAALLWMLQTGARWEGPKENYDPYDAALDAAAALLLKTYHDKTVLPTVAELIFRRNRKGLLIHDLVWSFFSLFDTTAPRLIAHYLLSSNEEDVALACKLLHLSPPLQENSPTAKQHRYRQYLFWLEENNPFLYPTGECFQLTSSPQPLGVDLDAKYMGKNAATRNKKPQEPLTQEEINYLKGFHEASVEEQALLASFSKKLHDKNKKQWERWLQKTTAEQLRIARSGLGVSL